MKYFSLNFVGQKPHECIECGKRFALGCNMKAHLKTHDPNRSNNSKRIEFDEDEEEELLNVTDWSRIYLISWRKRKYLSWFFLKKTYHHVCAISSLLYRVIYNSSSFYFILLSKKGNTYCWNNTPVYISFGQRLTHLHFLPKKNAVDFSSKPLQNI